MPYIGMLVYLRTTGLLLFMWVNTDKVMACVMIMTWTRVHYFIHTYVSIYTVHMRIRDAWGLLCQYVHVRQCIGTCMCCS